MSIYTVYEPPLRAADSLPDPERFVFVRDGFYFWAFLLPPLWMLWHRMWLALLVYAILAAGIENAMYYADTDTGAVVLVHLFLSALIGFEAGTLRGFALAQRGFKEIGLVSAANPEDAERRFFDAWARAKRGQRAEPSVTSASSSSPLPDRPQAPDVVGLFPEPGGNL